MPELSKKDIFLVIVALSAITISQPVLDIVSQTPEFLAVRYLSSSNIIIYAFTIGFILPVSFGFVIVLVNKLFFYKNNLLFYLVCGILLFGFFLMLVKNIAYEIEVARIVFSLFMAISVVIAILKIKTVLDLFSILSVIVIVSPIYFLFFTPINDIYKSSGVIFEKDDYEYGEIKNPKTVVLIVLDELSLITLLNEKENIESSAFKNIAFFLQSATWYKNTTTISNSTLKSIPSILTGNYPEAQVFSNEKSKRSVHDWLGLPVYLDYQNNIFTLLSNTHSFHVKESSSSICPYPLCQNEFNSNRSNKNFHALFYDTLFTYLHLLKIKTLNKYLPNVQMGWAGFDNSNINNDRKNIFKEFVNSIETKKQPQLIFLHTILPHMAWIYTENGELNGYDSVPGWSREKWTHDETVLKESYSLYYEQTKYVDSLLGELFDKLKDKQIYDESLIIVTADHGITIQPGKNSREVGSESVVDIMSVPLFIHYPGQNEATIDDRYASLIDIIPTIADVLNIKKSWKFDGFSLRGGDYRDGHSMRIYTVSERDKNNKFITIDYSSYSWGPFIKRKYNYLK